MLNVEAIRSDFPILSRRVNDKPLVYLDNAATTQKPRQVLDAMHAFYAGDNSNIHRGVHFLSEQASALYEAARVKVQQFINAADPDEIVFTRSATESINLVAATFGEAFVGEGDEIVVTEMEHHSNLVPWQTLCRRKGARFKVLPFENDGSLPLGRLSNLVSDRTKLLALTQVSNVLGRINPVREAIELAHARGVPVLVDGAQAAPHLPVDVQDMDCDFFAFSGHKMYAGTGIGVLYGKFGWLERMPPFQSGGGMIHRVGLQETAFAPPPLRFEAGTPHIAGAVGLGAAVDYLGSVGMDRIAAHEADVMAYAVERLQAVEGLTLYGDGGQRCGAVSFNLTGIHPLDAGMVLDKAGVAVRTGALCAEPVMRHYGVRGCIRASFGLYNTRGEVDALIAGLNAALELLGPVPR